jgi:hypothetical protein
MGGWFDKAKAAAIASGADAAKAEAAAGPETFMKVAVMPAILLVVFIIIYFVRKKSPAVHKEAVA